MGNMKTLLSLLILFVLPILFVMPLGCAHQPAETEAKPELMPTENYAQLALRELDQMTELVNARIKESQMAQEDKFTPLKAGLLEVYGRPNEDGMIDKIVSPLRNEIEEVDTWERAVTEVTNDAVMVLKNPQDHKPAVQVTYAVFLENIIGEMKPRVKHGGFEKTLMESIRDANIELSKAMRDERKLRMMRDTSSPSQQARQILERLGTK